MRTETVFIGKWGSGLGVYEAKARSHALIGGMERFEVRQDIRGRALYLHFDRTVFHVAYPAGECACLREVGVGKAKTNALDLPRPAQEVAQGGVLSGLVACEHSKPAAQLELNV